MTQVSIQTTGFELTQALSNTCQQAAAKLALSEVQGEKLEIFLSLEGKSDAKQTSAKIKITTPEQEIRSEGTRLNSSHLCISYAVFCLKKKS